MLSPALHVSPARLSRPFLSHCTSFNHTVARTFHASRAVRMPIQRVTCFKLTNPSDIPSFQSQYDVLKAENTKDGKPYIIDMQTGQTITGDARAQGYNFMALLTLENDADVQYFDEECVAHRRCKAFAQGKLAGPPLTVMVKV